MQNTECPAWVTAMDAPGAWADRLSDLADDTGMVRASCVNDVVPMILLLIVQ